MIIRKVAAFCSGFAAAGLAQESLNLQLTQLNGDLSMKKTLIILALAAFMLAPIFADQSKEEVEKMICSFIKDGTVIKISGKDSSDNNYTVIFAKQNITKYRIEFSNFYESYYLMIDDDRTDYNFSDYEISLDKEKNLIISEKPGKN